MIFFISIFLFKYNRAKYIPLGSPERLTPFSVECSLPEKTITLLEETISKSTAVLIFDNFTKIYIANEYIAKKQKVFLDIPVNSCVDRQMVVSGE
jgi:hypothetical protein